MGRLIDLPNISMDSLEFDVRGNSDGDSKRNDYAKNYLDTRVRDGEKEKTVTIRLLPIDLETGSPFVLVHTHNVRVPKEIAKGAERPFKTYMCLSKNRDIDHEKYGNKCPFCELNSKAYEEFQALKPTDPETAELYKKISIANKARQSVICRCIERGKEEDGVKFWKFNLRDDNSDPYHQIINLARLRRKNAEAKGRTNNILDIYEGVDLNITFFPGTTAPKVVDDTEKCPVSEDDEQMKAWIFDSKKWQDVFTCKPYEYLNLISQMRVPWFDKTEKKWVDKEIYDGNVVEEVSSLDAQIEAVKEDLKAQAATKNAPAEASHIPQIPKPTPASRQSLSESITIPDSEVGDDLPF